MIIFDHYPNYRLPAVSKHPSSLLLEKRWEVKVKGTYLDGVSTHKGIVAVLDELGLSAYRIADGKKMWNFDTLKLSYANFQLERIWCDPYESSNHRLVFEPTTGEYQIVENKYDGWTSIPNGEYDGECILHNGFSMTADGEVGRFRPPCLTGGMYDRSFIGGRNGFGQDHIKIDTSQFCRYDIVSNQLIWRIDQIGHLKWLDKQVVVVAWKSNNIWQLNGLSMKTGEILWPSKPNGTVWGATDNMIIGTDYDSDFGWDNLTGEPVWSSPKKGGLRGVATNVMWGAFTPQECDSRKVRKLLIGKCPLTGAIISEIPLPYDAMILAFVDGYLLLDAGTNGRRRLEAWA